MKGHDGRLNSYLRPPKKDKMDDETNPSKGWFSWLFGACHGGGAMISGAYTKLSTRALSEPVTPALRRSETIELNNALMRKFDIERQAWIEGAKRIRETALEQAKRAKDPKLNDADRTAAAGNARLFTKRYQKAMGKASMLQKQFENLEAANETLESGEANEQYLRAMQANTVLMKQEAEKTGLTPEAVGEIMDEFTEKLGEAQTLTREISRSIVDTPDEMDFDDQDAKDLLAEWLAEEEAEAVAIALDNTPKAPAGGNIPSTEPARNTAHMSGIGSGPRRIPREHSRDRVALEANQ